MTVIGPLLVSPTDSKYSPTPTPIAAAQRSFNETPRSLALRFTWSRGILSPIATFFSPDNLT